MEDAGMGLREFLHGKQVQSTSQRRTILAEVLSSQGHFDAELLLDRLRSKGHRVSRATVYRTLNRLQEWDLVREVFRADGRAQYEHASGHHDHMLCVRCGKVIEFADETIESLQDEVCRKHGFKALKHRMAIHGICSECRDKEDPPAPAADAQ